MAITQNRLIEQARTWLPSWNRSNRKKLNVLLFAIGVAQFSAPGVLRATASATANSAVKPIKTKKTSSKTMAHIKKSRSRAEVAARRTQAVAAQKISRKTAMSRTKKPRVAGHSPNRSHVKSQALSQAPLKKLNANQGSVVGRKIALRSVAKVNDSLDAVLGKDAISTSDQIIAENDGLVPPEGFSIARELGLKEHEYRAIWRKEQSLKRKLHAADNAGSTGLRRMLINDHRAWMREFLGQPTYDRYIELSR